MLLKGHKPDTVEGETVSTASALLGFSGRISRCRLALAAHRRCDSAHSGLNSHLGGRSLYSLLFDCCPRGTGSWGGPVHSDTLPAGCPADSLRMAALECGYLATGISHRQCSCLHCITRSRSILGGRKAFWAEKAQDRAFGELTAPPDSVVVGESPARASGLSDRVLATTLLMFAIVCLFTGCGPPRNTDPPPAVELTSVPLGLSGGPDALDFVEGRAIAAKPGQHVVLYAQSSGTWWVQPFTDRPFTDIRSNSTWRNSTHLGTQYAALLVDSSYVPSPTTQMLPGKGGAVLAVAIAKGRKYVPKNVHFSGYDWEARQIPTARGGKTNPYDPANAWTDANGFLHLRIVRRADEWFCAEVSLTRSLGQGSYRFTVRDVSHLDPAAVMTLYTWGSGRFHSEVDVEVSRWGNPADRNAQYVVQPYYEPANVSRFEAPSGPLTFSFHWEPGRVSFRTGRGHVADSRSASIAEHVFTSGVPSPGGESVHMNLYVFGNTRIPMRSGAEVIIEKFEYFP